MDNLFDLEEMSGADSDGFVLVHHERLGRRRLPLANIAHTSKASPTQSAAYNARVLKAELEAAYQAGGGRVALTIPGTYMLNDTLLIGSNVTLFSGPGVVFKQAVAINKCMLASRALVHPTTATVTIAWSAGVDATVTWANHGLTARKYVTFQGAAQFEYNNTFRVNQIIDANTFTIRLYRMPSATASGTITGYVCDSNIVIDGGVWNYDYANNPSAAQTYNRHAIILAYVGNFSVRNIECINVYKYGLNTCAAADYYLENITGVNVAEIYKQYGPCANGHTRGLYGVSRDDASTIQPKEPPAFIAYQPAFGDIYNILMEDINVHVDSTGTASGALVVYASANEYVGNIRYRNVIASSKVSHGISIKNGDTFTGTIDSVEIENVNASGLASTRVGISIGCNMNRCRISGIEFSPSDMSTNQIRVESTARIENLLFENVVFSNTGWPTSAGGYLFNVGGGAGCVTFRNMQLRMQDTNGRVFSLGTLAIEQVLVQNIVLQDGQYLGIAQPSAAGVRNITLQNVHLKSVQNGLDIRSLCNVTLQGCTFDTLPNGVLRVQTGTGLMCRAYSGGGNLFTSATAVLCIAPATADVIGLDLPVDPAATNINATAGNIAKRLATGRIMRADGAAWADI